VLPVILLAFANDKQNSGAGYLRGLTLERNAIRDALMKAEENGLCQVIVEPDVTVDRLFDIFQNPTYRDRIAIFHYGGHAESYSLLLESASGGKATAHSDGLVAFLAKQKSLKLVFLNGCSSQKQSEELIAAGLPAVIGTSQSINDTIATGLSTRFYKGLAAGMPIDRAWTDSVDQTKTENKTSDTSSLFVESILGAPGEENFPWNMYTGEGAAFSKAWNLPEAANQPLFGLELPKSYYRKLPITPYPGLRNFQREEAAIFFGRGADIRKLYTQLAHAQPVILFSGKKGVGKTSLLAAGLVPRLEEAYVVAYAAQDNKNLSDTLTDALDQACTENGLEKQAPADKQHLDASIAELRKSVAANTGVAKDILEQELNRLLHLAGMERLTYAAQWKSIEEKTGKPLVVILDELPQDPEAWNSMLQIMLSVFEDKSPPRGKLILSIDEQIHIPFRDTLQRAGFPFAEIFLQPLTWDGIQEAVTGITQSPVTRDFYRLQIEDTSASNLPTTLAGDLADGDISLVAPYLQVILSALWEKAIKENAQNPSFTLQAYQQGMMSGDIMDRFYIRQLTQLKSWSEAPVQSGLALDLLYLHTSALGKSNILDAASRKQIYGDRLSIIDTLVRNSKALYLLTSAPNEGTTLGHNLLAQVVIRHYSISLYPGQQAARILNARTMETPDPTMANWLNEADLESVENGMQGMRSLSAEELALVELSRRKKIEAQQERKRNRVIRIALVSIVAVFAALAGWQWYVADQRYQYARAGELAFTARDILADDNTVAINVAHHAYSGLGEDSPPMVLQALSDIFHGQDERAFYVSSFPHRERVFTAVFSPDGKQVLTASEDGYAKLWDITGKELLALPHEIEVTSAAFSPDGDQILTITRTHVRLWEKDGTLTDMDSIPETTTDLALFSSDGLKIIPNTVNEDAPQFAVLVESLRNENNRVISSPAKNRLLVLTDGHCVLHDETGQLLKDTFASSVTNAVFSADGTQFLTIAPDTMSSFITVWNAAGDSLYSFRCRGTEVNAVFSKDNKAILTASNDFTARLWDFSKPYLHRFPRKTQALNTIDYFPDGNIYVTASHDSTASIWDASGRLIESLHHGDVVLSAWFSPDGKHIVTASRDSTAWIWNPKTPAVAELRHGNEVTSAVFAHDGQTVLTASLDSTARLWTLEGKLLHTYRHNADVVSADFSSDDRHILTVSADHVVTLWDKDGDSLQVYTHPERIYSAAFSKDGSSLLTTCADSTVRRWSSTGALLSTLIHHEKPKIAFYTADGRNIITGGGKLVKIWDVNGTLLDSLIHTENVSTISVSPDRQEIFTACIDGHAFLWNYNLDLIAEYNKHTAKVNLGCFTPDGQHILTASDDGYVMRWRTPRGIFAGLNGSPVYKLTKEEKDEYGIR
jgi:WD40 repeat protein